MKHSYAAIRCKSCGILIALKYLGTQDGGTIYLLVFPPLPIYGVLDMRCESCQSVNRYLRADIENRILDDAPPADFCDQLPLASVTKNPGAS